MGTAHPAGRQETTVRSTLLLLMAIGPSLALAQPAACSARSGAVVPTVVELYTSEGCSSCPPADRWLSTLRGRADVLPLAFHVTYWDRLGWTDRFGDAAYTERQHRLARQAGRAQVYTPQVVANGQDWQRWPQLPAPGAGPAPAVTLERHGDTVRVNVAAAPGSAARWAAYWAVLEDQHQSRVNAGENNGRLLQQDHVVRLYQPVPPWAASAGLQAVLSAGRGDPRHPRRVAFVLTEAGSPRPLQALALGC
ncbi:DUF1223 domain-containing protein [Rubrivivax rivuli]|nr:DUF1223 domain-containing protein [Rubrivivax rivuli]